MRTLDSVLRVIIIWGLIVSCDSAPKPPRVPEVLAIIAVGSFDVGGDIAINRRTGYVYVIHSTFVNIIKGLEKVADVKTGSEYAVNLAIDEAGDWVYITNLYGHDVTVFKATQIISNVVPMGRQPSSVAIEPHSRLAYIVSGQRRDVQSNPDTVEGNILILSGTQIIKNLNVGRLWLTHVVADPLGGYIYVGDAGGEVVVIKGVEVVERYEGIITPGSGGISGPVRDVDADPRTGEVYVLDGNGNLRKFKNGKLTDKTKILAEALHDLRVHPLSGGLYITDQRTKEVIIMRNMKEIARAPVGRIGDLGAFGSAQNERVHHATPAYVGSGGWVAGSRPHARQRLLKATRPDVHVVVGEMPALPAERAVVGGERFADQIDGFPVAFAIVQRAHVA